MLSSCKDCGLALAEIDRVCSSCRSLSRFVAEARRLPLSLRGWATDQTRVWLALLQEESHKWRVAEEERQVRASATPKAPEAANAVSPPTAGGAPPPGPAEEPETGTADETKEGQEKLPKEEGAASAESAPAKPRTEISLS